jgi:hypothetical protein
MKELLVDSFAGEGSVHRDRNGHQEDPLILRLTMMRLQSVCTRQITHQQGTIARTYGMWTR